MKTLPTIWLQLIIAFNQVDWLQVANQNTNIPQHMFSGKAERVQ